MKQQNPLIRVGFESADKRICLFVIFLTENASRPALAVLAFASGKTRTSLRALNPAAIQAVELLPQTTKPTQKSGLCCGDWI